MHNPCTLSQPFATVLAGARILGLTALTLGLAGSAGAKTLQVETTLDNNLAPAGKCTLRDAISSASTDTAVGSCKAGNGADRIELGKGLTYVISVPGYESKNLAGDFDVLGDRDLEIEGNGSTIYANGVDRVMDIRGTGDYAKPGPTVTLRNLTLSGGLAGREIPVSPPFDGNLNGGGLRVLSGHVIGDHLVVTGNRTIGGTGDARGGGIWVYGGFHSIAYLGASLTLTDSEIANNTAFQDGGGLTCDPGGHVGGGSTCLLKDTRVANNISQFGWGGGIDSQGATTISLENCIVEGNRSAPGGAGGGIVMRDPNPYPEGGKLTLTNTIVRNNFAGNGGGLFLRSNNNPSKPHTLTITGSSIYANFVTTSGAAIMYQGRGTGQNLISQSTISGNSSSDSCGGLDVRSAPMTVANSTISGNTARVTGGGVCNLSIGGAAPLTLINTTVVNNTANNNVSGVCTGGVFTGKFATEIPETRFQNTIVSGNVCAISSGAVTAANCGVVSGGLNTSLGHNLDSVNQCNFILITDKRNVDVVSLGAGAAQLGPLADNGGPTRTCALLAGSPALEAGDDVAAAAPPVDGVDQRGLPRPPAGAKDPTSHSDIGAYEAQ